MQYIITFLLVTGTIFQIVQSAPEDRIPSTAAWLYPAFKEQFEWFKDIATGTTSDFMNLSSNMKNKLISVFTITSPVPNTDMVESVLNTDMGDGVMSEVKIVEMTIINGGEEIMQPDSKSVLIIKETGTDISQP